MQPINPQRLKQAREQAGLSLRQATHILGFSAIEILVKLEEGAYQFSDPIFEAMGIATAYGVSEAWLRGEETPLELTPEHLDQLANLSPANREHIIDFLTSIRGRE